MILYHGNKQKDMVPRFGLGKSTHSYGKGFYTTPDIKLAKEWAYSMYGHGDKGFIHSFSLDETGLKILDFTSMDSLHWLTEVLSHLKMNLDEVDIPVRNNIRLLVDKYKVDTWLYDVIIGYQADGSYFKFINSFVYGGLYKEVLDRVLASKAVGMEICIKSEEAFSRLEKFVVEPVSAKYRTYYKSIDNRADWMCNVMTNRKIQCKQIITDFI